MRSWCAYFSDLEELGQASDLEPENAYHNQWTVPNRNCCVSAEKLRILEFYSDFFDWYFEHRDLELIQMDAAISADWFEASFAQSCVQNLRQESNSGLHGTSGAGVLRGC